MTSADNHGMTKEEFSNNMGSDDDEREDLVIRARGLPWSATPKAVADFFSDCKIRGGAQKGIHFTSTADGRPSGEAFVELATPEDVDNALARSKQYMGKRYVEVFRSKVSEMKWVCSRTGQPADKSKESVLRLRGLPFGVSKEEIAQFFTGLEIVPNGITITLDEDGRNTGDAFVEFASPEIAEQAEKKHKEKIGHRYIEIFKSCKSDIKYVVSPKPKPLMSTRPGPYDRMGGMGPMGPMGGFGGMGRFGGRGSGFDRRGGGRGGFGGQGFGMQNFGGGFGGDFNGYGPMRGGRGGGGRGGFRGGRGGYGGGGGGGSDWDNSASTTGHTVHMRGLPYAAKEADVKQFFMPLNPVAIRIEKKPNGTATGVADVDFATHNDAKAAMSKDRQSMGHRYIELFLHSEDDGNDGSWNQGSGFGQGGGGSNSSSGGGGGRGGGGNFGGGNFGGSSNDNFSNNSGGNFGNQGNMGGNMSSNMGGNMGGNMSGNMGGNMSGNMGGNYGNFGGGGSGNYGNQANQGNFSQGSTGNFGGQQSANFGNQGTGFGQQSGFNSQGSSNFGQNQSTGNFGSNQNQQAVQGGGYNTNQQNTGNFGGSSNYGNQMGSNMNTGMNQPFNAQNAAAAATNYGNQSNVAQSGYGQGQQQSTSGYTDSSYASGSGSFFSGMQGQVKQEGQGTGSSMVTYPGYQ